MGDRRLGERVPAASVPITWHLNRKRRLFGKNDPITGHFIDISAVGAGILAPDAPDLFPSCIVTIEWEDCRAMVVIRHIEPGPVPRVSLFGVQFEVLDEGFTTKLDRFLGAMRPADVEAKHPI